MIGDIRSLAADYHANAAIAESQYASDAEAEAATTRAMELAEAVRQSFAKTIEEIKLKLAVTLRVLLQINCSSDPGVQLLMSVIDDLGLINDANR
jgi:hypothetical protein